MTEKYKQRLLHAIYSGNPEMVTYILAGWKFPFDAALVQEAFRQGVGMMRLLTEQYHTVVDFHEVWRRGSIEVAEYLDSCGMTLSFREHFKFPRNWRVHQWAIRNGWKDATTPTPNTVTMLMLVPAIQCPSSSEEALAFEYVRTTFGQDHFQTCVQLLSSYGVAPRRQTLKLLRSVGSLPSASGVLLFGTFDAVKYFFEELQMPLPETKELVKLCMSLKRHRLGMPPETLLYWRQRMREQNQRLRDIQSAVSVKEIH